MKFLEKYKIQIKLLLLLTIGLIVLSTLFYFLIPIVLNYPAGTYGTSFQTEVEGTNYLSQVLSISFSIFAIFVVITFAKTHFLISYSDLINHPENYSISEINKVKQKLFHTPYSLFVFNLIIPSVALSFIHSYTIHQLSITTLKLFILIISLMALYVTTIFIYTNNLFKQVLLKLPHDDLTGISKFTIKRRLLFNIAPLLFVSMLFICLLGYTKTAIESSNSLFSAYSKDLYYFSKNNVFSNWDDLLEKSKSLNYLNSGDYFFVKIDDNNFFDSNGDQIHPSAFFKKYLNEFSPNNNGRVYEYYGIDAQGATSTITLNGKNYTIGIYFKIISVDVLKYFSVAFICLLFINLIILILFSNSLSSELKLLSSKLTEISKGKSIEKSKPLSLTSADEIGDLIIAYNRVQKMTSNNIKQIKDTQSVLMEKERLATLGQMIGGVAHNLKTPIMSISGATEGLEDLVKEYEDSAGDPDVTIDDHHAIAHDMRDWIGKIRSYDSYMSDIITAVKGQAVSMSENEDDSFTLEEMLSRVNILMKHELKEALVTLNVDSKIPQSTKIYGNVNALVQVVNNLISNAIQAYGVVQILGKSYAQAQSNGPSPVAGNIQNVPVDEKTIDLIIDKKDDNIVISVSDHGCGMSDEVKNKLFKEMITTKGHNGSGLGLFMSYSTIKGNFKGDIKFTSEVGKGTTFNIILPRK